MELFQWHIFILSTYLLLVATHPEITNVQKTKQMGVRHVTEVRETDVPMATWVGEQHPNFMHITFVVDGEEVELNLKKNTRAMRNVPVNFAGANGPVPATFPELDDVAFYQDVQHTAGVAVTSRMMDKGKFKRQLEGTFSFRGKTHTIEPKDQSLHERLIETPKRAILSADGNAHVVTEAKGAHSQFISDQSFAHLKKREMVNRDDDVIIINETTPGERSAETFYADYKSTTTERSTNPIIYDVEVMFVLDWTVWQDGKVGWSESKSSTDEENLLKIRYWYSLYMNAVDMAYSTIDAQKNGFKINVWLKELYIARTEEESPWNIEASTKGGTIREYELAMSKGLANLNAWSVQDGRNWSNPDHTVLWTRQNLVGVYGVVGVTSMDGVCWPHWATSICEANSLESWGTFAHELAHNLGAFHDGQNNDCSGGSIMGSWVPRFSQCSIDRIKEVLAGGYHGYPRTCLTNRVCDHAEPNYDMPSLDVQCSIRREPGFVHCEVNSPEEMCSAQGCSMGKEGVCTPGLPVAEFTTCGPDKWCRYKQCVPKPPYVLGDGPCVETNLFDGVTIPEGCTDEEGFNWKGEGCESMVFNHPDWCFTWDDMIPGCCFSCRSKGLVPQQ